MLFPRALAFSALAALGVACSATASSSNSPFGQSTSSGGSDGVAGGTTIAGSGSVPGASGSFNEVDNGSTGTPDFGHIVEMDPNAADCAGTASKGEQITVDIFIMFDQSASMTCMIP